MKKKENKLVSCLDCKMAVLRQRGNNPIIAECPLGLNVARPKRFCDMYVESKVTNQIIHV